MQIVKNFSFRPMGGDLKTLFSGIKASHSGPLKKPAFTALRPNKTYVSLDQSLLYVGDNSRYSKNAIFIISLFWVWYGCIYMGLGVFTGGATKLECFNRGMDKYVNCDMDSACKHHRLSEIKVLPEGTIVSDFKLICGAEDSIASIASSIFVTNLISTVGIPTIMDKFGRKKVIVSAGILSSVALFFCGLMPDFQSFMVFFWLGGLGFGVLEISCRVYVSEISGPNYRCNANSILNVVFVAGQIMLSIIHVFLKGWRAKFTVFFGGIFLAFSILGAILLDESPRFLETSGKLIQCKKVLRKMSGINRRPLFHFNLLSELTIKNKNYKYFPDIDSELRRQNTQRRKKRASVFQEIRSLWQYLMIAWVWIVYNFSYYGFQFAIILSDNFMIYFILLSLSEFFGNYIDATVNSVKYMLCVAAICCLVVPLIGEGFLSTCLFITAKFMMSFFSGILLSYTMQLFPTHFRAQGYSLCTLISKIAVIFMPSTLTWFTKTYRLNPLFFIGLVLSSGAVMTLFMIRTEEADTAEFATLDSQFIDDELNEM